MHHCGCRVLLASSRGSRAWALPGAKSSLSIKAMASKRIVDGTFDQAGKADTFAGCFNGRENRADSKRERHLPLQQRADGPLSLPRKRE